MMIRGKAVIAAGAGSGKTRVLAAKVAYHVNELGVPLTSIMATSFTRKSAAELNDRIGNYGVTFTKQAAAGFGTTHSIARKLMMEYGGPIRGDLKSYAQKTLIRLAMKQVEMTGGTGDPQVTPLVALAGTQGASGAAEGGAGLTFLQACEKALDNRSRLNPFLRGFIESFFNPRDQWYSRTMRATKNLTDPAGLTEKQMGLLQGIFKQTGVSYSPSTDPNLTKKARTAAGKPLGFDKYVSFNEPARQWFNLGLKLTSNGKEDGTPISPGTFAMAITNFKGKMVSPSEAWTRFRSPEAAVYGAYEYLKGSNGEPDFQGTGDFDDVLIDISKFLLSNPAALQKVQNRFKTILIDEAQDQNRAQHLMFGLIAGYVDPAKAHLAGSVEKVKDLAYDNGRISADTYALIGDDKQAIYEFRSADPASFIDMRDLVGGGAGFTTAVLNTNYRSGKHIVDTAMNIIRNNDKQIPMVCEANPERIRSGAVNAVSFTPVQNGDFREPAMWFAETVEELMEQDPPQKGYSGFGIGVRTNAEAYAYSLELLKRGIPFKSKTNFFGDKTTKAMIAWLTLADETGDVDRINDSVLEATSAPKSMLGQRFVDAVKEQATGNYADWLQTNWSRIYGATGQWARAVENFASNLNEIRALNGQSPQVVLAKILALKGVDGLSFIEALKEKVREDEDAMSDLRSESAQGEVDEGAVEAAALAPIDPLKALLESRADLTESMKYIRTLQAANNKLGKNDDPEDPASKQPAVTIGTVHSWKGLEVENMFVPFTGGKFPRADAEGDDLESDRRLAYVAVTRGEERVYIMDIPTVRQVGEKSVIQTSRFVEEACVPTVPNWESPDKRGEDDDDAGAGVDPDEDGEAAAEAMARIASKLASDFLPLPPGGTWLSDEMIKSYESIKAGGR
jgi:DNA helicase-2/ATP-dependent DNA helicase PcrA